MFEFNEKGLYVCITCGKAYEPGHAVYCNEPKQRGGQRQVKPQNIGRQIEDGMLIIYMCEQND